MNKRLASIFMSLASWKIILMSVVIAVAITTSVTVALSLILWNEVQAHIIMLGVVNATLVPVVTLPYIIRLIRRMIKLEEQNQIHSEVIAQLEARRQVEADLQRRADELSLLYQFGLSLASGGDLNSTLAALHDRITQLIRTDTFYVAIYNMETDVLSFPVFFEEGKPVPTQSRLLYERPGLTGAIIFGNKTLYLPDVTTPEAMQKYHPLNTDGPTLRTFLGIPLAVKERVIGAISIQCREVDAYTPDQIQLMETLSIQAALAIEKAGLFDQLQRELVERRKTEQALAFSEKLFYQAFHISPVMMTIENGDQVFTDANPAFIEAAGYSRDEVVGHHSPDLNLLAFPEDRQALVEAAESKKGLRNRELHFRRKSGKVGVVLLSSEKFDVNGEVYELTAALDITERKRIEAEREKLIAELRTKNVELEQFTYTVSHDLKAPIITVKGFLGYLEKDIEDGRMERAHGDLKRINEAVDKMYRLLNELLELSRIGRMMNPSQPVSLNDLANEALENVHGRLAQRGAEVVIQPNLPVIFGDRPRLVGVLQNLIDNAAKFMGDQSKPYIEIGQLEERDGPVFFVHDNGIGISSKYHEQVFGLFNKLNPDMEGTGMGLSLAKRIIEVHGGRIWIESEPGQGATFYFTLPKPPKTAGTKGASF